MDLNDKSQNIVFARKYRPQIFKEVVGQDHIVSVLKNAVSKKRISHAYLFSGPRGTGKTTIARILARELGCMSEDIIEIDAASSRGIDEARALRDAVQFLPMRSPYKVYIIDEVHMLTKEAFNALLKTLEEPPKHVIFIMATTELNKVMDTIVSRTQQFRFRKISISDIVGELARIAKAEKFNIKDDALKLIAFLADGSLRDAENMLLQIHSLGKEIILEEDVRLILGAPPEKSTDIIMNYSLQGKTIEMLAEFDNILKQGIDPHMLAKLLLRNFRALYFLALDQGTANILLGEFAREEIDAFRVLIESLPKREGATSARKLEHAVSYLLNVVRMPADDFLPQIPLELALIKIATEN